jgi:hypothetical protein
LYLLRRNMAERIYHDQMNDKENPNDRDAFVPRNENGTYMDKSEAMDKLHREALKDNGMSEAQIRGRERIGAFKEAAGRGVERCRNIYGGVKEKVGQGVSWLKKAGVSAAGVGERVLGSEAYVQEAAGAVAERGREIRDDLKSRAEAAKTKMVEAGQRTVEKGKSLWASALEKARGVYETGREKVDAAKRNIKDKMNEMYAGDLLAKAERSDVIADNEEDKAAKLLASAANRRESAQQARDKAAELAPWLFEAQEDEAGTAPEAAQSAN